MATVDFITELFCRVDEEIDDTQKHSQANLYPSEVVTLALLYALSGKGQRAFWRWLSRDYRPLFPNLPHRTRLFRLFNTHRHYVDLFLADPSILGVIDSYGIELLHPIREGRSEQQRLIYHTCSPVTKPRHNRWGLVTVRAGAKITSIPLAVKPPPSYRVGMRQPHP